MQASSPVQRQQGRRVASFRSLVQCVSGLFLALSGRFPAPWGAGEGAWGDCRLQRTGAERSGDAGPIRKGKCLLLAAWAALGACAPLPADDPPAYYVLVAPLCLAVCAASVGSIRETVSGGSGGSHTLTQSQAQTGGVAVTEVP